MTGISASGQVRQNGPVVTTYFLTQCSLLQANNPFKVPEDTYCMADECVRQGCGCCLRCLPSDFSAGTAAQNTWLISSSDDDVCMQACSCFACMASSALSAALLQSACGQAPKWNCCMVCPCSELGGTSQAAAFSTGPAVTTKLPAAFCSLVHIPPPSQQRSSMLVAIAMVMAMVIIAGCHSKL